MCPATEVAFKWQESCTDHSAGLDSSSAIILSALITIKTLSILNANSLD